ncbi:MAG: class I SAM-dependent methyltransferase [Aureispira sp.]|nr:class I SAM-dependent methyltransferase [Aureispira sp.]
MESTTSWFASWFDSPYYHQLYQHRNDEEAQFFMSNLIQHLAVSNEGRVLDLACGKGRHSIYLASKGLDVVGVDLSPESIAHAQQFGHERLSFGVHDMRESLEAYGQFDYIFNLFTSFGYFDTLEEHQETINQMAKGLKGNESRLVIDFFNAHKVIQKLVLKEEKTVGDIDFDLQRYVENGYIVKNIRFEDKGELYHFQERVRALSLEDFEGFLKGAGLEIEQTFGDFALNPFDLEESDRLILIAKPC